MLHRRADTNSAVLGKTLSLALHLLGPCHSLSASLVDRLLELAVRLENVEPGLIISTATTALKADADPTHLIDVINIAAPRLAPHEHHLALAAWVRIVEVGHERKSRTRGVPILDRCGPERVALAARGRCADRRPARYSKVAPFRPVHEDRLSSHKPGDLPVVGRRVHYGHVTSRSVQQSPTIDSDRQNNVHSRPRTVCACLFIESSPNYHCR